MLNKEIMKEREPLVIRQLILDEINKIIRIRDKNTTEFTTEQLETIIEEYSDLYANINDDNVLDMGDKEKTLILNMLYTRLAELTIKPNPEYQDDTEHEDKLQIFILEEYKQLKNKYEKSLEDN